MQVWKTVKLFLSSTFLDLELERDQLAQVFQEQKQQLNQRQLAFILYDLRWRDKHEQKPLVRWCLEMVEQCEYFVAIIANRYGWCPPHDRFGNPNHNNLSITEMEIDQALESVAPHRRFFFFLRDPQAEGEEKREIRLLREKLRERNEQVFCFTGSQEMLQFIPGQLSEVFAKDYPVGKQVAPQEQTVQQQLQEFMEQKTKGFVGRVAFLKQLFAFVQQQGGKNFLVVSGTAGLGKSSLLARFIQDVQRQREVPVVAHFVSMGGGNRRSSFLLRSLLQQLTAQQLVAPPEKELAPAELPGFFRQTLENFAGKLVVVIDGLDELAEKGGELSWLPRNLPAQVRVVLATRPVGVWEKLQALRAEFINLPPLQQEEIGEIIAHYCQSHELSLPGADCETLCQRAAGNPLYLKVALEEMISTGVAVGQLATSVESLFSQILARLQQNYGAQMIQDYLGWIAASRFGLTESELKELWQPGEAQSYSDSLLLEVSKSLENFILRRGQLFQFFHPEFERTIKQNLGRKQLREYHRQLARYFQGKGYGYARSLGEICYQQQAGEEYGDLLGTLCDFAFLEHKSQARLLDSLLEDFAQALSHPAFPFPKDLAVQLDNKVAVNYRTLELVAKALNLDLPFLKRHPELMLQTLWNRGYWHDSPESALHYQSSHTIEDSPFSLYRLVEKWRQNREAQGYCWLKSQRPLEPHLDSELDQVLKGHNRAVTSIALSNDGTRLASGSKDGEIRVWDAENGECLLVIHEHHGGIRNLAFSDNGKWLASAGEERLVFIWEVGSGECLQILEQFAGMVNCLCFTEKYLVTGSEDGQIALWNIASAQQVALLYEGVHPIVKIACHGDYLATASKENKILLWSLEQQQQIATLAGHDRLLYSLEFADNGECLVSASKDQSVRIWHLDTLADQPPLVIDAHEGAVCGAFLQHRKVVSIGEDNYLRLWHYPSFEPFYSVHRPEWNPTYVAFCPRNGLLVCGSQAGEISLWRLQEFFEESLLKENYPSRLLTGHSGRITDYAISQQTLFTCSSDRTICQWSIGNATQKRRSALHSRYLLGVSVSPDHKRVATASEDGRIYVWNHQLDQRLLEIEAHQGMISKILFHPDNQRLISLGYFDNTIRVWNSNTGENLHILAGHEKWIEALALSHDGEFLATGARDKTVRLWNLTTGACVHIFRGHVRSINSLAFHPDDSLLASGGYGGEIHIWNPRTRALQMVLQGHQQGIVDLAFAPGEKKLYSASLDLITKSWDIAQGVCINSLPGQANLRELLDPDKPYFTMLSHWEMALWDKKSWQPVAYFPEAIAASTQGEYVFGPGSQQSHQMCFLYLQSSNRH